MPIKVDGVSYLTTADVLEELKVSRQTLWRWRSDGKVPRGSRFRNNQLLFTQQEFSRIGEYANRIEPMSDYGS